MKILIPLAIAAFVAPMASVHAQDKQVAAATPAKEKKICRSYKVTGSLTRVQRICRTEEEWRLALENTKTGVDELQNGASGAPKCLSPLDAACPENSPGAF